MENNEQGPVINPVENPAPAPVEVSNDEKTMAMLAHLLGIFTSFIAPLIIFLMKKDQSAFVAEESKEALNFQIMMAVVIYVGGTITCGVLAVVGGILTLIWGIMACLKARDGIHYKYPINLRLIK